MNINNVIKEEYCIMDNLLQPNLLQLSKYVINYVNKMGHDVNHLKLQKLIYYLDAWHNVILDKPLIKQDFEAWMHGPVCRELWDYYKDETILYGTIELKNGTEIKLDVNNEQLEVINDVLDEYGDKTSYYLECLTHEEKPWDIARIGYSSSDRCENVISKAIMKEFYEGKLYEQG